LICGGRVLELIVTSLVRDVSVDDMERILINAPYHSATYIAATRAVHFSIDEIQASEIEGEEESGQPQSQEKRREADMERYFTIRKLAIEINKWRKDVTADLLPLSPWMVYGALNKTFHQTPLFNRPLKPDEPPKAEALSDIVASGLSTFNSFWAALASFEKGPLFDLPPVISNVNLVNRRGDFTRNDLYTQNIAPLADQSIEQSTVLGEQVLSTTRALKSHPIGLHLHKFFEFATVQEATNAKAEAVSGRSYLLRLLGLPSDTARLNTILVKSALKKNAPEGFTAKRFGVSVFTRVSKRYPEITQLAILRRAIDELTQFEPDSSAS
jgi:hypothetical protein